MDLKSLVNVLFMLFWSKKAKEDLLLQVRGFLL